MSQIRLKRSVLENVFSLEEKMNLLFSVDDSYTEQIKTTLYSVYFNTPVDYFDIYVLQKEKLKRSDELRSLMEKMNMTYHPIIVRENIFEDAPCTKRFPEMVYYRLLAHELLPKDLDKVLYLDADILCINDLRSLYQLDLAEGSIFGAANHAKILGLNAKFNNFRIQSENNIYFNSGVLLINLSLMRQYVNKDDILKYIQANHRKIVMPDQDLLNALYGDYICEIPNKYYNVDTRWTKLEELFSKGELDENWYLKHATLLHYCGSRKPWQENATNKWDVLYKNYRHHMKRLEGNRYVF